MQKQTHAGAIIDALAGIEDTPHPLSKSPCRICAEMVCEKDTRDHDRGHHERPQETPSDEELNAMAATSERQDYFIAD